MNENEEAELEAPDAGDGADADALDPEPLAADLDDLGELLTRDHEPNEVRYGAPPPG